MMRSTKTWSPISSVFSIELDGMVNACSVKVMMKSPVTSTTAMEAMNSGVVSLGFSGLGGSAGAFCCARGAVFTGFFVVAKFVLPHVARIAWSANYCGIRNMRFQRRHSQAD